MARTPDSYTPRHGVKVNNPLTNKKRVILNHIVRSINSVPKRQHIRILSWNIRSDAFVDALIKAHQRGVSVRVLISLGNANPDNPNKGFNRLQRALRQGNADRRKDMRSWARKCDRSCRGGRGIAHAKIYLFSKVGQADDVVMYSSANATEVAVARQWNDIYTMVNRSKVYDDFVQIFTQLKKDQPVKPPYAVFKRGKYRAQFLPWGGKQAVGDPVLNELDKIRCKGATDGSGAGGRTVIRIGQTAILNKRGIAIAQKLKSLWDQGCNIRIVYALMGNNVLKIVRDPSGRGAIPIQQIAQDWQGDGVYDRYLHMKVMTVSGVYGKDTAARVAFNGTANWTGLTMKSDEVIGRIFGRRVVRHYSDWIEWLYHNPPPQPTFRARQQPAKSDVPHHGIEF